MHVIFSFEFSFLKYIDNMTTNIRFFSVKKKCHLVCRQPHSILLQPDVYLCSTILCTVYNYFILFHP